MVLYETKTFKIEIDENGCLIVDEGGRKLNIDISLFIKKEVRGD